MTHSMIKKAHLTLQQRIIRLLNKILIHREFPSTWDTAIISSILKKNRDDIKDPRNYKPILLTNCLCKILKQIVNVRLMWHLVTTNRISQYRAWFRHSRSSTDHIVQLEKVIRQEIPKKKHTTAVLFDIRKAYDTAWWHYIVMKLKLIFGLIVYIYC